MGPKRFILARVHSAGRIIPAVSDLPLYLFHVPGRLRPQVLERVLGDGFEPILVETPVDDPYRELDTLRRIWREGTGYIEQQQASLPPPGGLLEFAECPELVCSRPHDCRAKGQLACFASYKVSAEVTQRFPDLADRVFARPNGEEYWRRGWLANRPYSPGGARLGHLNNACLDPEKVEGLGPWPSPLWPTTMPWPVGDADWYRAIEEVGITVHYHPEPSVHLWERPDGTSGLEV